jgi:hypothetical protein
MPQAFRPFGLRPVANSGGSHGNEVRAYPLANGASCPNLGRGSPVKLTGGVVVSVGAAGDGPILGVAAGFQWVDAVAGPVQRNAIPAGTSSAGTLDGENRPMAFIHDNPSAVYMVQADASVSRGDLGLNFVVSASGGDVQPIYGTSRYALRAASRTSAITGSYKLIGLARISDNTWDDPFPVVVVEANRPLLTETSAF